MININNLFASVEKYKIKGNNLDEIVKSIKNDNIAGLVLENQEFIPADKIFNDLDPHNKIIGVVENKGGKLLIHYISKEDSEQIAKAAIKYQINRALNIIRQRVKEGVVD